MGDDSNNEKNRNVTEKEMQVQNKGGSIKAVNNIPVLKSYTVNNSMTPEKATYVKVVRIRDSNSLVRKELRSKDVVGDLQANEKNNSKDAETDF